MIETLLNIILSGIEHGGYVAIVTLMAIESANIPIPSEVIMPFSGFLVASGVFSFWIVVIMGTIGNVIGSLASYGVARRYHDSPVLLKIFLLRPSDIKIGEGWFKRFGSVAAFISRFVPIIRTFISFPAGIFRVPLVPFSLFSLAGSFVWSLCLTYAGVLLGEHWNLLGPYFHKTEYAISAILVMGIGYWIYRRVALQRTVRNTEEN